MTAKKKKTRAEFVEELKAEVEEKDIVVVHPRVGPPRPFHKPIQSGSVRPFGNRSR